MLINNILAVAWLILGIIPFIFSLDNEHVARIDVIHWFMWCELNAVIFSRRVK